MKQGLKRTLLVAATAALVVGSQSWTAAPAEAHNYLVSSTPADGSTITELPPVFDVTTNEDLLELGDDGAFAMEVRDAAGLMYGDGCLEVAGPSLTMGATLGEAGLYSFTWQVVSADGHTVSGDFSFTWQPAEGETITPGSATAPECGVAVGSPSATPSATPTEEPTGTPDREEPPVENAVDLEPILWIGGTLLVLGIATAVALYLIGRRRK